MPEETLPTILLADDDHDLAQAISSRLMHMGFRVSISHDALSALVLAKHDPPDLVVMDIHMPCGNGICVLEMLRSDERWSRLPVAVLSGAANGEMIQRIHALDGHYICKSATMWPKLQAFVESHLGQRQPTSV